MSADEIFEAQSPVSGWRGDTRAFRADAGIDGMPRWADFDDPLDAIGARASEIKRAAGSRQQAARFTIYLPVHNATPEELARDKQTEEASDWSGGGRILLVEDEDTVRAVAERALTRQGYTVVTAADGDEGLEEIRNDSEFDLVVSDVVMPSMDGPAMAREIRKIAPRIPVLFMSGYAEEQLRREIDIEGMHFIPKPFSVQQIAAKVGQVLGGQRGA
jgi:two-component system cell cycle sensor histidine kinase/response regulator CckA